MDLDYYKYSFVQNFRDDFNSDSFLKYKRLFKFKSTKSHKWYYVWVEVYDHHIYAVKFHLKEHNDSPRKYNIVTGLNEARMVINTCIRIMSDIASSDPRSSFGFIGANSEGEKIRNSKRFQVYSSFMATYVDPDEFMHITIIEKSAYMLVRRSEIEANPDLVSQLNQKFKILYDYFE